jgi:chromate reductase, NAD(P)H dehydrogenase (quinone)
MLALCGSLRARSSNRLMLEAAQNIIGSDRLEIYAGLAELPAFNPDLDTESDLPAEAKALRDQAMAASALLVSVPEYAHGLPGSFKNGLDWLVGSMALFEKPVAIWANTSRAIYAPAQLREVLTTMAAAICEDASITIDVPVGANTVEDLFAQTDMRSKMATSLQILRKSVDQSRCSIPY